MSTYREAIDSFQKLIKENERLREENKSLIEKLKVKSETVKELGKKYEHAKHDANRYQKQLELFVYNEMADTNN